jgi:hypothetical protein
MTTEKELTILQSKKYPMTSPEGIPTRAKSGQIEKWLLQIWRGEKRAVSSTQKHYIRPLSASSSESYYYVVVLRSTT